MRRLAFLLCGLFVASSIGTALALSAPTIKRTWAWNVTSTGASVTVEYTDFGLSTHMWFEYSTSSTMTGAKRAPEVARLAVGVLNAYHSHLGGLQPATTYHFRAYVRTEAGTASSAIGTFTTAAGR
jgi:hypothetical protein